MAETNGKRNQTITWIILGVSLAMNAILYGRGSMSINVLTRLDKLEVATAANTAAWVESKADRAVLNAKIDSLQSEIAKQGLTLDKLYAMHLRDN